MRRLPSDVALSLEVKASKALTRVVYAETRPALGERPLYCADGETPAQALHAFAAALNVPLTVGEAETVYLDGVSCDLWRVDDGVLVLPAFPPSVLEARAARRAAARGARGGMSAAEKQARYREAKAKRAASSASPGVLLPFRGGVPPLRTVTRPPPA